MKESLKNKVVTSLVVIATIILAGVAIFTALKLYQLRKGAVAPTAPESRPEATGGGVTPTPKACKSLTFSLTTPTPTVTPRPTATPTATPTTTATPTPTNPPTGGTSPTPTSTATPTATPTATQAPTATPTGNISTISPTPAGGTLPGAGISFPTILSFILGTSLIILALSLAI